MTVFFQAHQNSELPATITFLALIHFLGNTYIVYISGTSLGWKKNDLFLENQVFGKRIGKNQSRGLPGIYSTSYPSWGDVGHILAFLAHLRVTIPTQ